MSAATSMSRIGRALDFASDWALLAFALWTLIAWSGMATEARVSVLVPVWIAAALLAGVALVALHRRGGLGEASPGPASEPLRLPPGRRLAVAGVAGGLVASIVAGVAGNALWPLAWAGAFVAVAAAVGGGRLTSDEEQGSGEGEGLRWPAHVFAALAGLGFAVMSLFINRPDADNAFYINRATATAQLDRIPVRDVLFTDELVGPTSAAGLPIDTFSALEGALGRFVGVHAGSFAFYVTTPVFTFLATWALWRLLRAWAPRSVVLCFVLACVYWLFSAQSALTPGSVFLTRMWQGKVVFAAWLVLVVYALLTRWLARRDALTAVLLLAAGLSSVGMTGSASFVAPLLFATAAIPLLARREWRGLPIVAAAGMLPLLIGFAVTRKYSIAAELGGIIHGSSWYFHEVFGVALVAAVGVIAVWVAAPWLARSGPPARLATGLAVVALVLLTPGLLPTISDASDLSAALRRTLWIVPLPALVGLLAAVSIAPFVRRLTTVPWPLRRLGVALPALVVAALLAAFGHPLWTSTTGEKSLWTARPDWKTNPAILTEARAILRGYRGRGPILAEERIMGAIALLTVEPKAVNARRWYAFILPGPRRPINQRLGLTDFVEGRKRRPPLKTVSRALSDLRVDLVCPRLSRAKVIADLESTDRYAERFTTRELVCYQRV